MIQKQKLQGMHRKHSEEMKKLEMRLGGIVQNTNNELEDARNDAVGMERELTRWKRER